MLTSWRDERGQYNKKEKEAGPTSIGTIAAEHLAAIQFH